MLTLGEWLCLDDRQARAAAAAVARSAGGELLGVGWPRTPRASVRPARVARIGVGGDEFVLVAGGTARLGFDAGRFDPTDEEVRSFLGDHDALRPAEDPDRVETPVHGPVLGQLALFDEPAEPPAPRRDAGAVAEVRNWLAERVTAPRVVEVATLLVAVDAVEADAAGELGWVGRRLPTPDEWEYAWGLGPGTLFPWGDRVLAALGDEAAETVTGLRTGNMYYPEQTSVPGEVRAGDFGVLGCGGETRFFHAVLRAPAFRDPGSELAVDTGRRRFRAVIEVGD